MFAQDIRDHCIMYSTVLACVIVIIIIVVIAHKRSRETLTVEQCGLTGVVSLPYDALSRFTLVPDKDSADFAEISREEVLPSDLAARHRFLAQVCDETPGCVAFNSDGYLKSGILPQQAYVARAYTVPGKSGLFVRKCAVAEELYAELYQNANYGGARWLLKPGKYPKISSVAKNDSISSIRVPVGLKITAYNDTNYRGASVAFRHGNYPSMSDYGINDKISSMVVEYDNLTDAQVEQSQKTKPATVAEIAKVGRITITDPKLPPQQPATAVATADKIGRITIEPPTATHNGAITRGSH